AKSSRPRRTATSSSVVAIRDASCPVHIAGSARTLTRSLMQRRSRKVSLIAPFVLTSAHPPSEPWKFPAEDRLHPPALTQLAQEPRGWHEERLLLENGADDDRRIGAHGADANSLAAGLEGRAYVTRWS